MARGWMTRSFRLLDHDPEIDKFKAIWREEHLREKDLAVLAGLHAATIHNMFSGQTRRPRHTTFASMAKAMGYEYTLHREIVPEYSSELPKAQEEYRTHLAKLAKERAKQNGKGKK